MVDPIVSGNETANTAPITSTKQNFENLYSPQTFSLRPYPRVKVTAPPEWPLWPWP